MALARRGEGALQGRDDSTDNRTDALSAGKRRYNIKLWKTFTDCFNCLPIAAIIDEKIFTMHGGLSPDLQSMEQIRRVMRPTDVPDTGTYLRSFFFSLAAPGSSSSPRPRLLSAPPLPTPANHPTLSQDSSATSSGQTRTRTSPAGRRTIAESRSRSDPTSSRASSRSTTWTSFAARTRSSRMDTSSSPRGSS